MENTILEKDLKELTDSFELSQELQGKTILVTGGTGLIGSLIIRFLLKLKKIKQMDLKIFATARSMEKARLMDFPSGVRWISWDMTTSLEVEEGVDFIIHTACPTQSEYLAQNPVEVIKKTLAGAVSVFEYAKENNAHAVFLSSIEIYGQFDSPTVVSEADYGRIDPLSVRSCYPESKRLIECLAASYAKEYGVDIKIARLTQTFGAGIADNDNRVFAQFARAVIHSEDIILHTDGQSAKSYIYTTDAIRAIFYILLKGTKGEAYNVANKKTYLTILEMAQYMIERFNPAISIRIEKKSMGYAPDTKINLDTRKLEALGWYCRYDQTEMFERLVESLKSES